MSLSVEMIKSQIALCAVQGRMLGEVDRVIMQSSSSTLFFLFLELYWTKQWNIQTSGCVHTENNILDTCLLKMQMWEISRLYSAFIISWISG